MSVSHDESYSIHVDNLGNELKATLSDELVEQYRQKYTLKKNDRAAVSEQSTVTDAAAATAAI